MTHLAFGSWAMKSVAGHRRRRRRGRDRSRTPSSHRSTGSLRHRSRGCRQYPRSSGPPTRRQTFEGDRSRHKHRVPVEQAGRVLPPSAQRQDRTDHRGTRRGLQVVGRLQGPRTIPATIVGTSSTARLAASPTALRRILLQINSSDKDTLGAVPFSVATTLQSVEVRKVAAPAR